ncbi:hypothetical protein P692DRAFT_20848931 [Suillus brevipes Sb2]|nr:hypothetical protein P692DRAFT_20848931 [Suillus brevipes Sb2]
MGSRSASVPVTHGQEGTVLHVGEDEREAILKTLRNCAFNRWRLSPLHEVDRESRKVVYSINTSKAIHSILGQAPRRALSVPLTSNNGQRKHSRLANVQCFDASALDHPDVNTTGARALSNIVRTHLLNPSDLTDEESQQPSFHERPFPKGTGTGTTRWFRSSSTHQLLCPNEDIASVAGDLYIHTNTHSNTTYLWVLHPVEGWIPIETGGDHPTIPKRRLRIRKDGDPSWVQNRSLISIQSRERCR